MSEDRPPGQPERLAHSSATGENNLWRDHGFQKVFTARVASSFGSVLGGLALVAILIADARPGEMAALTAIGVMPGILFGLSAGAWADRVKRRVLLMTADFGRVVVVASIPIAHFAFSIHIEHLYAVAFFLGLFRTLKEVASPAFLPSVVGEKRLFEANSKITAGLAIVETTAFAVGGWIAQLSSAVVTTIVQAIAYLTGGLAVLSLRKPEPEPEPRPAASHIADIRAGFTFVRSHPVLLVILISNMLFGASGGIIGSLITLFAISEVGFQAGVVGLLYAIGGISSLIGSIVAMRFARRIGIGNAMAFGWIIPGILTFFYPLAPTPLVIAAVFFAIPQLFGDAFWTIHDISEVSLRQIVTPAAMRGRVNSLINSTQLIAELVGAVIGGVIAETVGLRAALGVGAGLIIASGLVIYLSPVRKIRDVEDVGAD